MPLDTSGLQNALADIFESPPATTAQAAHAWAQALGDYFATVVPPSTTVSAATAALEPLLLAAFGSPAAPPLLEAAFLSFATQVGAGMAPAFVGVPPVAPVGFALLAAPPFPATRQVAVAMWAAAIDAWAHTGTATPVVPGPPVIWS